ncbi:ADP-ribosyltransferase, partial [Salmonella enterica]|uniref:ADP-ribosyltransferase n=1 Tax=Salmonella enterica TaxID=28901 RepID=UPI003EDC86FC
GLRKGKLLDLISNLEIGNTFKFDNFISTTLHFQYAISGFTARYGLKRVVMKIHVNKNTSCAYVSKDECEAEL